MTVDRFFSICPFRVTASDSDGFQFVLLGRLLLAVEGLLSVLFRLSSSDVFWAISGRVVVRRGFESLTDVESLMRPPGRSELEFKSSFVAESSPSSSAADPDDHLRI